MTCREATEAVGGVDSVDYDMSGLVAASRELGLDCSVVAWDDPTVDWSRFAVSVLRSTWNYFMDREGFLEWARRVAGVSDLHNDLAIVEWNTDKHYLAEIARAGLPVVPTTFLEPDHGDWRAEIVRLLDHGDVVVKPCVSAGSNDTDRHSAVDSAVSHVESLLDAGRSVMLQPYLADVDIYGETGLVFIDGVFSHAFGKGAILAAEKNLTGGLYAEEDISAREATAAERELGERAVDFLRERFGDPLYARVDLLPTADGPVIIEVELTEPSLYLALGDGAARAVAAAVARRVDRRSGRSVE